MLLCDEYLPENCGCLRPNCVMLVTVSTVVDILFGASQRYRPAVAPKTMSTTVPTGTAMGHHMKLQA